MNTCTHLKADGAICRAVAMKNKTRCYFHNQTHARQRHLRNNQSVDMPVIEDAPSIQLALMDVINRLAQGTIETRNAGLILYALQIASSNLRTGRFTSKGWLSYEMNNAKLMQADDFEEREESASQILARLFEEHRQECIAEGPVVDEPYEQKLPFINACADDSLCCSEESLFPPAPSTVAPASRRQQLSEVLLHNSRLATHDSFSCHSERSEESLSLSVPSAFVILSENRANTRDSSRRTLRLASSSCFRHHPKRARCFSRRRTKVWCPASARSSQM